MRNLLLTFAVASISGALSAAPSPASVHHVRKGETAASIARANGLSLAKLAAMNPKVRLSKLRIGMILQMGSQQSAARSHSRQVEAQQVPSLPSLPVLRDSGLIHLERVLPLPMAPEASANGPQGNPAELPEHLATQLHPVLALPADSDMSSTATQEFSPADRNHLDLIWPVETRSISSNWGPRMRTKYIRVKNHHKKKRIRYRGSHKGIDLNAPQGTSVFAAMDGRVIAVGKQRQYGNFITIDHGNGIVTHYGHDRTNLVEVGDVVRRGQKIAEVGRTGNATGPHLHFELRLDGRQCNPLPYMNDEEEISSDVMAMNAHIGESRR